MHVSSNPAFWYATRASGIAAFVILTVVVALGISMGGKVQSKRWPKFTVEDIHRFGGFLVGALIAIHVVTIAVDSFLPFSVLNLLVPFTASYRPIWTGLGIAAAELLLALAVTNHYRKRLPYAVWRKAHYANFAVWMLASVHGVMSGTDRGVFWLAMVYGVCIAGVVGLCGWRFSPPRLRTGIATVAGIACGFAVPLVLHGPLYHAPPLWNANNITENLTGRVVQNGTNLTEIVSFVGEAKAPQKLIVRADLLAFVNQGIKNTSLQLEYLPSGDICRGAITNLGGQDFTGTCRLPNGETRQVAANWAVDPAGTGVIGQIQLSG